jgi:hypothetical protein
MRVDASMSKILLVLFVLVPFAIAQEAKSPSVFFHNDRLKRTEDKDSEITGNDKFRGVSGVWVPESKDPAKALVLPEQAKITCTHSLGTCQELKVILGPVSGMVLIESPEETIWEINSWDAHGLLASYGPDAYGSMSEKCHRHILTMSFSSGAVSTSDIPTHEKGCEAFSETDSYRLARGQYYVDTTPGNDANKSAR